MIKNLSIGGLTIDCADAGRARDFYAGLMGYKKAAAYGRPALIADNGLTILFAQTDIPYAPPVWPEEPGEQQKQMHLDFSADDFPAAVERAMRLGAVKAAAQYGGDGFVTLLDTEGHPFCLSQRSNDISEYDLYFEKKGYGRIPNVSINIDCQEQKPMREFYAQLTGWDRDFHWGALVAENGMIVCFQGCDQDATMDNHIPPVWPEESGKQQKQMHFDFMVDDLPAAVAEAVRLGATKTAGQCGVSHAAILLDIAGHPFCLCKR